MYDITLLPYDSLTYVSVAHGSSIWLGHAICSRDMHNLIKYVFILDKPPSSNHLPIFTVFNIVFSDNAPLTNIHRTDKKVIKWSYATRVTLDKHKMLTKKILLTLIFPLG